MSHAVLEYHSRGFETHRYVYSRLTSCDSNNLINLPFYYNDVYKYPLYCSNDAHHQNRFYASNQIYPLNKKVKKFNKGINKLDKEIAFFCKHVEPTEQANKERENVVTRIRTAIESCIDPVKVEVFGSFKTGLYLPSSDIDIVVFHKCPVTPFDILKKALIEAHVCDEDKILILYNATVPIIKLIDKKTEVKVDIGFNIDNAPKSAVFITTSLNMWPPMKSLLLVLKQLLIDKDLNEVYTGGISSYSLTLLILYFLESTFQKGSNRCQTSGGLLVDFLDYYAYHFDYRIFGIAVSPCCLLQKPFISDALVIRDPLCPTNDVARGSYRFSCVQNAFKEAYNKLNMCLHYTNNHQKNFNGELSVLSCVIEISHMLLPSLSYQNLRDDTRPYAAISSSSSSSASSISDDSVAPSNSNIDFEDCDYDIIKKDNLFTTSPSLSSQVSLLKSTSLSTNASSSSSSSSSSEIITTSDDDNDYISGSSDSGVSVTNENKNKPINGILKQLAIQLEEIGDDKSTLVNKKPPSFVNKPQQQQQQIIRKKVLVDLVDVESEDNTNIDTIDSCPESNESSPSCFQVVITSDELHVEDCESRLQQNADSPDILNFPNKQQPEQKSEEKQQQKQPNCSAGTSNALLIKRSYRDVVCHSMSQHKNISTNSSSTTKLLPTSTLKSYSCSDLESILHDKQD